MRLHATGLLLLIAVFSKGQSDTLMRIKLATGEAELAVTGFGGSTEPVEPNRASLLLNNLPDRVAESDLIEGTHFTKPALADQLIDVTGYPVSTTIQMITYLNNKAAGYCSGTMVAPNLVLSSAHCILNPGTRQLESDEVIVVAMGKNAIDGNTLLSKATAAYILKTYYNNRSARDIMLLELADPVGDHTGWMAIAALPDSAFGETSIFHKLSFPALPSWEDPRTSKDRKLYYNYGFIDVISEERLGIANGAAVATPGQSGSALFYFDHERPFAVGVAIYSRLYQHQRITTNILSSFRPIIARAVSMANEIPYTIYPNPVRNSSVIRFGDRLSRYTFVIASESGEVVHARTGRDDNLIVIERGKMSPGTYSFRVIDDKDRMIRGTFTVQ